MIDDINIANLPGIGSIPQIAVPNEAPEETPHPADVTATPTSAALPQGLGSPVPSADEWGGAASLGSGPIGTLSPAECKLFKDVVAKYFPEETGDGSVVTDAAAAPLSQNGATQPSPEGDDVQLSDTETVLQENGFGIGIPETKLVQNLNYEEADVLNSDQIRGQFPVLSQKVNGHDLVWFDNGATTQKPLRVIDGLSKFYKTDYSNIHRGAHTLAARSTDQYEAARQKVADFINAPSQENIVFVRGTTEGINLIAHTFGRKFLHEGDNVIVSTLDHHANIVPWQQIAKAQGAELRAIPVDQNGDLILSDLERLISPQTKFVSVGHVNNTFGTINDVRSIIRIAHSHGIPVLIDGAQSIAHTKVDVQELDADFFVFSGHKIYGPSGIGVVYGKKEWLAQLPPWQGGGNMIKDVTIEKTEFNAPPARFEAGTPNIADAIGLGYALDFVNSVGIYNIERHEHELTEYARQQIARIPGITIIGNPRHRVSVISLDIPGIPAPEVGQLLDKEGIAVRAGHHCAQPALRALGYEMSVRPTFAVYNTKEEVDRLVIALQKIVADRT
ncbi:MAG: cysteine desulfurase [Prevotella sp.]|nr:cysteine desulfurase [Prevotella sp.]